MASAYRALTTRPNRPLDAKRRKYSTGPLQTSLPKYNDSGKPRKIRSMIQKASVETTSPRRHTVAVFVALLVALALGLPTAAWADQTAAARAEALFREGRALLKQNKLEEACAKFTESMRVDPSVGALVNLGRGRQFQGKTATAYNWYRRAAAMARQQGENDRATAADQLAAKLEPSLSRLTVKLSRDLPQLIVKRDDKVLDSASFGVPIAVDPGAHKVSASAPGHRSWSVSVIVEKNGDRKVVTVPPLEPDDGTVTPVTPPSTATAPPPPPDPSTDEASGNGWRKAGIVLTAVGAAAVAVGAIIGGTVLSDANSAQDDPSLCPDKRCSDEGYDLIEGAQTKAIAATVTIVVGGAAAVAGIVLLLTAGSSSESEASPAGPSAHLIPSVHPGGGGLVVLGRF